MTTKQYHLATVDYREAWQVHKLNCKDVLKLAQRNGRHSVAVIEADSPIAVVKRELSLNDSELIDMGYSENDFRIMPCCKEKQS